MRTPIGAGAAYSAAVLIAGTILGTIRVMLVAPAAGELGAVLLELPLMLAWSWAVCGWLLRRLPHPVGLAGRATVGATGFVLLMAAETGLAVLTEGRSVATFFSRYDQAPALAGLLGQIGFGLIPLLR
jgi:hypothetical protein